MVDNVNVRAANTSPNGGAGTDGTRQVYFSAAKAAQNDTITVTNVNEVLCAQVVVDTGSGKAIDTFTITDATNLITLTGSDTGTAHIMAIVK